jgi:hypothetical protein
MALGLSLVLSACGHDRTFEPQLHEAGQLAQMTISEAGGNGRQVTIRSGGIDEGFQVIIYGTSDHVLLSKLTQVYIYQFQANPKIRAVDIRAYAFPLEAAGNTPIIKELADGPILSIRLRRQQ